MALSVGRHHVKGLTIKGLHYSDSSNYAEISHERLTILRYLREPQSQMQATALGRLVLPPSCVRLPFESE